MPTAVDEDWTVGRLLEWTIAFFKRHSLETPRLDAEVLLAKVLDCRRIELYAMYGAEVAERDRGAYREMVRRRADGCPAAYLTGHKEFYARSFDVGPAVLIPRPETEHLVIEALAFAKEEPVRHFLDIGCGSGILAVTLAKEWPSAFGMAVDVSSDALAVALGNAKRHGVAERITLLRSDLFACVPRDEPFDLIVSNPPYVAREEFASLPATVRDHEPRLALDGGAFGLEIVARIIEQAARFLRPKGRLLLEIGSAQESAVRSLATGAGFKLDATANDLAGHPRVIRAIRNSATIS